MTYPQYRKYKNHKSYFKISSAETFEEVLIMGKNYSLHQFTAKILPDRNFISDMLHNYSAHWDVIDATEYDEIKSRL